MQLSKDAVNLGFAYLYLFSLFAKSQMLSQVLAAAEVTVERDKRVHPESLAGWPVLSHGLHADVIRLAWHFWPFLKNRAWIRVKSASGNKNYKKVG